MSESLDRIFDAADAFGSLIGKIQFPFMPQVAPEGPSFLDTEACLCALQTSPGSDSGIRWQCIGNQTTGVYTTRAGKWFDPQDGTAELPDRMDDASNPPVAENPFRFDSTAGQFLEIDDDDSSLDPRNRVCTGRNRTSFSASFYAARRQQEADEVPVDGLPCYRPGDPSGQLPTVPIVLQDEVSWRQKGCSEGFLCTNNTFNSLPQICPPISDCQLSRLATEECHLSGRNIGMGPFEPVVCQKGFYCPPPGNETIRCPSGHYCQPGAPSPTPCLMGSICPEGTVSQIFIVPPIIMVVIDIALVLGILIATLRARVAKRKHQAATPRADDGFWGGGISNFMGGIKTGGNGRRHKYGGGGMEAHMVGGNGHSHGRGHGRGGRYGRINEEGGEEGVEEDTEMLPLRSPNNPDGDYSQDGFQGALRFDRNRMGSVRNVRLRRAETFNPQVRAFLNSTRRATDATELGLFFTYNNLSFHPKKAPRPVLQAITGSIPRGNLVAVMGGSGAGKSTFVNTLMGKQKATSGSVTINNTPGKISAYKKVIGYVPQDDIVLPELTVRENIAHSAKIRLPSSWSTVDIEAHVDSVIDCLELSHVRDSLVGSVGKPVISGGQRKRVSIGMELAAAPMAIFLDEPTSGLDATAASSIMLTLKALARLGISIIVIIHQPRMEIFEMLDNLILLGSGQHIYEGPQTEAAKYFTNLGFRFPKHSNEGDVITDIVTGNGRNYKKAGDVSKDFLIAQWSSFRASGGHFSAVSGSRTDRPFSIVGNPFLDEPDAGEARTPSPVNSPHLDTGADAHADAAGGRRRSNMSGGSSSGDDDSMYSDPKANRRSMRIIIKRRGAPHWKQFWLCLKRAFLQQYRTKSALFFEVGLAVMAGFLIGLAHQPREGILFKAFYNPPYQDLSIAADVNAPTQFALLQAIAIGLICGAPGVKVFSEEMIFHRREAEAGHSRSAYFLAKTVSVLPRMILGCLHFTAMLYVLARPIVNFGIGFSGNLLYFYCIYGLSSCVSMLVRREDAPLISTMIGLIAAILSGAAPTLKSVKTWRMDWLWRASPGLWFAEMLFSELVEPFRYLYQVRRVANQVGYELVPPLRSMLVLLGIGTIYRVLAFFLLFLNDKIKRR